MCRQLSHSSAWIEASVVLGCLADAWPLRAAWVLLFCALVWRLGLLHPPRQDDNRARTSRTPR